VENKKLSIIIVTYNSSGIIEEALYAIEMYNDIGNGLEVIVVDNASRDTVQLEKILKRSTLDIKFIKAVINKGYGAGNNIGIGSSSAPLIMIMNPDVRLLHPIFSEIVRNFSQDASLAIAGLQQYENTDRIKNHSFIISSPNPIKLILHKFAVRLNYFNSALFCFSGACFVIRKSSFLQAGGFDNEIFLYGEESDLQYRVKKSADANKISFFKSLGYLHKTHDRNLDISSHLEGVQSFLHSAQKRGISKDKMLNKIIRFYRFIYWYNTLKMSQHSSFYRELNTEIAKLKK